MNINYFYYRYHNEKTIMDIPTYVISFYDLTFVLEGELHYKINNKHVYLKKNDIILIPPNSTRARLDINHPAEYASFNFYSDSKINLPMINRKALDSDFFYLIQVCNSLTNKMADLYNQTINDLIKTMLSLLKCKSLETNYNVLTKNIIKYINDNIKKKITLQDISKQFAYSESYCCATFKKDTGNSIINYYLNKKIADAKILLIESSLPIKAIAESVGFDDQNYFSRTFKKITKLSPLNYKNKYRRTKI